MKKHAELRELGIDELKKRAGETRHELFMANLAKHNQQLKNPLKVKELRHQVARILTIIREKGDK
jgi:large subunit ribosomal protein L29